MEGGGGCDMSFFVDFFRVFRINGAAEPETESKIKKTRIKVRHGELVEGNEQNYSY